MFKDGNLIFDYLFDDKYYFFKKGIFIFVVNIKKVIYISFNILMINRGRLRFRFRINSIRGRGRGYYYNFEYVYRIRDS